MTPSPSCSATWARPSWTRCATWPASAGWTWRARRTRRQGAPAAQGGHGPGRRALPRPCCGRTRARTPAPTSSSSAALRGDDSRLRPGLGARRLGLLADKLQKAGMTDWGLRGRPHLPAQPGRGLLRLLPQPGHRPHPRSRGPPHRLGARLLASPGRSTTAAARTRAARAPSTSTQGGAGSTTRARRSTPWTRRARRSAGARARCWWRATSTPSGCTRQACATPLPCAPPRSPPATCRRSRARGQGAHPALGRRPGGAQGRSGSQGPCSPRAPPRAWGCCPPGMIRTPSPAGRGSRGRSPARLRPAAHRLPLRQHPARRQGRHLRGRWRRWRG